jgi:hypothetical protein
VGQGPIDLRGCAGLNACRERVVSGPTGAPFSREASLNLPPLCLKRLPLAFTEKVRRPNILAYWEFGDWWAPIGILGLGHGTGPQWDYRLEKGGSRTGTAPQAGCSASLGSWVTPFILFITWIRDGEW